MPMTQPTVRVNNPEKLVEIQGDSFAELILHQCMHVENLRRVVQAIGQINAKAHDERLSEVQAIIQAMVNSSSGLLIEQVRIATAQGLAFEISEGQSNVRH